MSERKKPGPKPGKKAGKSPAKKQTGAKRGPKPKIKPEDKLALAILETPLPKKSIATTPGLKVALDSLNGKYGAGTIRRANSQEPIPIDRVTTGHYEIDKLMGGGSPRGRVIEIFGPESCLVGDTLVQYNVVAPDGRIQNSKGGTIENLYYRFNGIERSGQGYYTRPQATGARYTAPSINDEDRVFQNDIVDVIYAGVKPCFEITTESGETIQATGDHKFYTGTGYKKLKHLSVGDSVQIHNGTRFKVDIAKKTSDRKYLYVNFHPVAGTKYVEDGKYQYHRILKSRATVEAATNGLTLPQYVDYMNTEDECSWNAITLPREMHVHHIDENHLNDELSNLMVVSCEEHGREHAIERHNNLRFICVTDIIKSITAVGKKPTYDIKMSSPANNFVANKFVVHNSGKTTLAQQIIANYQAVGLTAAFLDNEHATDFDYNELLGVNMDDLILSQPDSAEQTWDIIATLVKSGAVGIIVVDSTAAMPTKRELEGAPEDEHVAELARINSKELRKLTALISKSNTTLIFIGQLRDEIGKYNPHGADVSKSTGGRAIKFYASTRLGLKKIGPIYLTTGGDKLTVGQIVEIKTAKNKLGPALRTIRVELRYPTDLGGGVIQTPGFDGVSALLMGAVEVGLISGGGQKSYTFPDGTAIRGAQKARDYLASDPDLMKQLLTQVTSG